MDITSFILGRKNGRDSVKTQEKTVTPSESEIVVTPDTGYDALSKVTIEAVEAGGGSGESVVAYKVGYVTATGTWNERISVDFGFKPDFLLVFPEDKTTVSTTNFVFFGFSQKIRDNIDKYAPAKYTYVNSGVFYLCDNGGTIDSTYANAAINCADETGFNFGKTHAAGSYWVYALKLV